MIKCRLRILLAEHEILQKELAELTGVQVNTISKMCRNEIFYKRRIYPELFTAV